MFKKDAGRSFFLIDDQDEIDSFPDLNSLVDELRKLGIRRTEIHL